MDSFTTGLHRQKNLEMSNLTLFRIYIIIRCEKGDGESLQNELLRLPC